MITKFTKTSQGYNKPFTSENNIQSIFHYEITSHLIPNQTTGTSTCVSLVLNSAKEKCPLPPPTPIFGHIDQPSRLHQQSQVFFFQNVGNFFYIHRNCQSTDYIKNQHFFSFLLQSDSDMLFSISKPANIG